MTAVIFYMEKNMPYGLTYNPLIVLLLLSLSLPTLVFAEENKIYDQVNLSASASMEVENDTLIAILYAQKEGSDLGSLTNSINQQISAALKQAKQSDDIKVQTLGYQTSPIYQQTRLSGWRVKQSIRLESRQSEKLSQLISQLQTSLALESISYAVSTERQKEIEEQLIGEAIGEFQHRARMVTNKLGHKTYRLVDLSINTSGQPIRPMRMRASMMSMERAVAAPALEAGTQTLEVSVNGRIELQID
jgi:predicted secreted protein